MKIVSTQATGQELIAKNSFGMVSGDAQITYYIIMNSMLQIEGNESKELMSCTIACTILLICMHV
jgi:hypothetical protein